MSRRLAPHWRLVVVLVFTLQVFLPPATGAAPLGASGLPLRSAETVRRVVSAVGPIPADVTTLPEAARPPLELLLTAEPVQPRAGEVVTLTATLVNRSGQDLPALSVDAALAPGLSFRDGDAGGFVAADRPGRATWQVATLATGERQQTS